MKKYRVNLGWLSTTIAEVEVERETEYSVWVKGNRYGKSTSCENYFDTYEKAYVVLVNESERIVNSLKVRLDREEETLKKIKGLKIK